MEIVSLSPQSNFASIYKKTQQKILKTKKVTATFWFFENFVNNLIGKYWKTWSIPVSCLYTKSVFFWFSLTLKFLKKFIFKKIFKIALRATCHFFSKTPRIWTFQKIDPEISAKFLMIFCWFFFFFFQKKSWRSWFSKMLMSKTLTSMSKKRTLIGSVAPASHLL